MLLSTEGTNTTPVWSPDGEWLVVRVGGNRADPDRDIFAIAPTRDSVLIPIAAETGSAQTSPTISPDGRWVAYSSDETGQSEIWIRSFPDGEQVHQISTEGGIEPVWIGSGELFYHRGHRWMVVRVSTSPQLQWEPPQLAFETEYVDTPGISYDVSSDGRYLYVVKSANPPDPTRLYVVQNWFEELKRLVPTDN